MVGVAGGVVSLIQTLCGSVGTPASGATCSCGGPSCCTDTPLGECLAGMPGRRGGRDKQAITARAQCMEHNEQAIQSTMQ